MRSSIMSGLMILPFTTNALSATTANTIQGTAPTFKAVSGENRLGFTVGGTFYSQQSGNIDAATPQSFSASLTFNDFAVKVLDANNFTVADDYDDSDGDGAHLTTPFTIGGTTYKWTDNNGIPITGTNLSKMLGCGSGYAMPLKLEITLDNVQVHSEYGDPRDSVLTPLKKTYQINATSGICFAKADLTWYGWNGSSFVLNSGSATPNPDNGGGYSSDFIPTQGFSASASTKFPTTGFPGAKFQLVTTGAPTDWTYNVESSHTNDIVSVDTTGNVLLSKKPVGEVIVSATLTGVTPVVKYEYKFTLATNGWFVPKGSVSGIGYGDYATAGMICGTASNLPTRAELTNSPRNSEGQGWSSVINYYTRAIGGGVFSEWGRTDNTIYPSSQWVSGYYWTQDVHAIGSSQFIVYSRYGFVNYLAMSSERAVTCRG